jgi:hypothetical protein
MASKGRPTLYKGIQMRSRLEADFAAYLDVKHPGRWEYEPTCFAGPQGQWLPDFRIGAPGTGAYVEVKPLSLLRDQPGYSPYDAIDKILRKMEIARLSEPECSLDLVFWEWGNASTAAGTESWKTTAGTWIASHGVGGAWRYFHAGTSLPAGLWPGMGQQNRCAPARSVEIEQMLLQGLLLFPGVYESVSGLVSAADYWRASHRAIHQEIADLAAQGVPVVPMAVADELNRRGELSRIGGAKYLYELVCLEMPEALKHDQSEYQIYARCIRKLAEDRLVAVAERAELERAAEL